MNKDPDIVLEEDPIIILDGKSAFCMANTCKDTNYIRHISRRVYLVRNGEKCKMHKIDWFQWGLKCAYIATKNVSENDLNPRLKYIMVRLDD